MLIAGVAESTFYRYVKFMKASREARDHGNTRLLKPREHIQQAIASLKCILDREADHMPHRTQSLKAGEKVVSKILLASFQWKDQLKKLNNSNAAFGLKEISTLNLSKIKSTKFLEFDVKKAGDNFARCATCDKLNELVKGAISGSQIAMKWMRRLDRHLTIARAHRDVYYINRDLSFNKPHECVTIIHDKMDHSKTACPAFSHKSKELDGLMKLPVSVTGMLVHDHTHVQYAHYGLDVFSHDSNYTIGSMAKLLRDLELPPKSSSRELFTNSKSTNLFKAVLEGADMCNASLPLLPNTLALAMQLPPILNVQMDNATGDNKNTRYVFSFWSLLVANKIFRKVYVNFMIVDHMHDDIDALFGRWSMDLKKDKFPTVPALMKLFIDMDSIPTIPHLIEEVPDFKAFIAGSFVEGNDVLVGHTKPHQLKFYLDSTGCPVMKYKLLCSNVKWLEEDRRGIKLWKEDVGGQSL